MIGLFYCIFPALLINNNNNNNIIIIIIDVVVVIIINDMMERDKLAASNSAIKGRLHVNKLTP